MNNKRDNKYNNSKMRILLKNMIHKKINNP